MNRVAAPADRSLVLLGGGHAHVAVLKSLGMRPIPGVRISLVARDVDTPYSGMLPGFVAGRYSFDDMHIDLEPLARFAGAALIRDEAVGLDPETRRVLFRDRPPMTYDAVSLNIGATPSTADVPGAGEHAVAVKPINNFIDRFEAMLGRIRARPAAPKIGVVGAGAGGVELLFAVRRRLRDDLAAVGIDPGAAEFHLIADTADVLPTFPESARAAMRRRLQSADVFLHLGRAAAAVEPGAVVLEGGARVVLDEILWTTAAAAPSWLAGTGLATDSAGFVQVDATLRSVSHPGVFAVGDVAAVDPHPRPKAGVFAVRQGPPLAENLRRTFANEKPRPFEPQRRYLSILSTGDGRALAVRGGIAVEGAWVWRWKDWIDRRWMRKYQVLPQMNANGADSDVRDGTGIEAAMRCGGCGGKIPSDLLRRALAGTEPGRRDDMPIALESPDDAAVAAIPPGTVSVQTVDFFRSFVDDPYVFAEIAANHALGDLYAMGAEPQSVLMIATIPFAAREIVESQLSAMLAGAAKTIRGAGAVLAGGHTAEGSDLAVGFAANGFADPAKLMTKGGLEAGQKLVLTKPLGTGALFAAAMRGKAKGRWIENALQTMRQTSREASGILAAHGAKGCTDVTGFGFAGHLAEMTSASGVGAAVDLSRLPILEGTLACIESGIVSTLHGENARFDAEIDADESARRHRFFPILFDPQTAGGLLAGVPAAAAESCVAALRAGGCVDAVIVGDVVPARHGTPPIRIVGS